MKRSAFGRRVAFKVRTRLVETRASAMGYKTSLAQAVDQAVESVKGNVKDKVRSALMAQAVEGVKDKVKSALPIANAFDPASLQVTGLCRGTGWQHVVTIAAARLRHAYMRQPSVYVCRCRM